MAAPTVTSQIIEDGFLYTKVLVTALFGSSQESDVVKVDLSELTHVDPDGSQTCFVHALKWNISGSGVVTVKLAGPVTAAELSGHGEITGGNLAPEGGDVQFTTTGMASGDTYQIEVTIQKAEGFVLVPVVVDADITNEGNDLVTGDTLTAEIEFDSPVFVKGQPQLEVELDSGTVLATCVTDSIDAVTVLEFEYLIRESDQAEAGEVDLGEIVLTGSASVTGGFAEGDARLSFTAPDTSAFTVNAEPEE